MTNRTTTAPVRPAPFQLFRNLAPPIEAALRASIYRFGVLVPVAKDQHGSWSLPVESVKGRRGGYRLPLPGGGG